MTTPAAAPDLPFEITAPELAARLAPDAPAPPPVLVDVREAWEFGICALPGSRHLPLGTLPTAADSLEGLEEHEIVTICHHGVRSLKAALWLRQRGFSRARSLGGGIDHWARTVDSTMAFY